MYWPHGVPRVYAVNGPDIAYVSEDREVPRSSIDDPEPVNTPEDDGQPEIQHAQDASHHESQPDSSPDNSIPKWEDEAIRDVCASRSGQLFATISESSIVLWQTRVR